MAKYRQPDVNQYQFVTLNFAELFPAGHAVPRLLELVRQLDLSEFNENYENDNTGRPAMPVDRVLAILFYSLLNGEISLRKIDREMKIRADLMYLSGGMQFDHSSLAKFRIRHATAIQRLFAQTVFLGMEASVIDLENIAIDSTKIKAVANRRDIGTKEQLARKYEAVKQACEKHHRAWMEAEDDTEEEYQLHRLEKLERRQERLEAALSFLENHPKKKEFI